MVKNKALPLIATERLLALVPYISAHQGVSIKELSEIFGVTASQINNDLTTLWMCGLPGYTPLELMDLSFESGYVTIQNAPTLKAPRSLTFEEIISLLFGLDLVRDSVKDNQELQKSIEKLVARLSEKSDIQSRLRASNPVSGVIRAAIEKAIDTKGLLTCEYHSLYSDQYSVRTISPLELRIDGGVEYLFAYCVTSQAFRTFRVDRIGKVENVEKTLDVKAEASYQDEKFLHFTVKIHNRLRAMKERFYMEESIVETGNSLSSYSAQWILRSIIASRARVEIIEPEEIRLKVVSKAQEIMAQYASNERS